MKLIKANKKHKDIVLEFKEKIIESGERFCGVSGLERLDFDEWLERNKSIENKSTCPEGIVPAFQYIYVDDDESKVIGMINLRLELNDLLMKFGGHIGYSIVPDERRKGHAKAMLMEGLKFYKKHGYERVLITCDVNNIASAKTIEACGGELENIIKEDELHSTKRYWIKL